MMSARILMKIQMMILTYEEQSAQCRLGLLAQHNWDAVFLSGKHDLVEPVAEGKEIVALRLLVIGASKGRVSFSKSNFVL
jgi:hypothetical protein